MKIIILSTSLFTDRIILYSSFLDSLEEHSVEVWTSSYPLNKDVFEEKNVVLKEFPKIGGFKERYNYLRKICNASWAKSLNAISILSMKKFNHKNLSYRKKLTKKIIELISSLISFFRLEAKFENYLHGLLSKQERSNDAFLRFASSPPDLLVITNPFWHHESAVAIEAKKLNIKTYSFIPSWDNITTKSRFVFKSDFYGVWSVIRKEELLRYYPYVNPNQIEVLGAPQYDVFFNKKYISTKEHFLKNNKLEDNLPIVLYVLGSPNFLKSEIQTCVDFIKEVILNETINNFQILVRPHPNKDNNELKQEIENLHKNVKIQKFKTSGLVTEKRAQTEDQISEWISTFKYTDILINLSSTSIFDSLYFDKPVININFDDTKNKEFDEFIKEINSTWIHLKTVKESGVVFYANSIQDIINQILSIINGDVVLDKVKKNYLLDTICNNDKGESGSLFYSSVISKLKN